MRKAHFEMHVGSRCRAGLAHKADDLARLHVLAHDHVHQTHVSVHRVQLLVVVSEVVADRHRQAVRIGDIARRFAEQPPARPNDRAGSRRHDGRAFGRGNIHAGMHDAAPKEHAAVAIIRDGPVGLVRGNGTGEEEMIVGGYRPGNGIKRRTPVRDRLRAGSGKAELERLRRWSDKRLERDLGLTQRFGLDHRRGRG